ncbi:c-type cytochrome [Nevskia ramosa]|uniref:c-type cytochrome n=1 Tax=Nevskia ramosa TaxID=64002 RepID=UPI003D0D2DA6
MKTVKTLLVVAVLGGLAGLGVLYSGLYPMGADVPHNRLTYWALETLRERSIARAIRDIEVPPLDDSGLLLAGGEDYNEMCTDCHLKPGKTESEFTLGLYPQPPNLSMSAEAHHHAEAAEGGGHGDPKTSAARQFWIIKHGIKASGMAAFGATHDDGRIWAMVAFLQKLPALTPAQYQILTARSAAEPLEDAAPAESSAAGAPEESSHEGHTH